MNKFVLLGARHAGGEALRNLLIKHPHIRCAGEIFGANRPLDFGDVISKNGLTEYLVTKYRNLHSLDFLHDTAFRPLNCSNKVAGFEILYGPDDGDDNLVMFPSIWSYIKNNVNIKILHVKRRNRFARLVDRSLYILERWINSYSTKCRMVLTKEACIRDFLYHENREAEIDKELKNHAVFNFCFEDLPEVLPSLLTFIGVDNCFSNTELPKLPSTSFSELLVSNFNELKEEFKFSKYQNFFEVVK